MVELLMGEGPAELMSFDVFEARIEAGRIPPGAKARFEPVTGDVFVAVGELDLYRSLREGSRQDFQRRFARSGPPIVTALLVGLQIRIYLWTHVEGVGRSIVEGQVNWLSPALENAQPWRLIGSGLLHNEFLHILMNMVWMTYCGWNIERALGRANLAAIFFFSVFGGGILSMFLSPAVPSLGASGGVYGLVSASVVFGFVRSDLLATGRRELFGLALLPYLVLLFFSGLSNPGVDNWAHFGGLVTGGALAFVLQPMGLGRDGLNRSIQVGGTAFIAVVMLVLGMLGPRLHPLVSMEDARTAMMKEEARRRLAAAALPTPTLRHDVPAGWRPGFNTSGDAAFLSPTYRKDDPKTHSYSVTEKSGDIPADLAHGLSLWKTRLSRSANDMVFTELEPQALAGQDASTTRSVEARNQERVLVWTATQRGAYLLSRVSEVRTSHESRLAPLFVRLDSTIEWERPESLRLARANLAATPNSVRARQIAAVEEAKWGEIERALEIAEPLLAEQPEDLERLLTVLDVLRMDPKGNLFPVVRRLFQTESSRGWEAASGALRARNQQDLADGWLLWRHQRTPGGLRSLLRKAGLRWSLDSEGNPSVIGPLGEVDSPDSRQLEEWARLAAQERLLRFETESDDQVVDAILRYRDGGDERQFDKQSLLLRELRALRRGKTADWMKPGFVERATLERIEEWIVAIESEAP